jgi:hypothetical protein
MSNKDLERMFELTDKFLAPYHNGIAEGEQRERERIIQLVYGFMPPLLMGGATQRDKEAFAYAIWQFRHHLVDAIKEGNE